MRRHWIQSGLLFSLLILCFQLLSSAQNCPGPVLLTSTSTTDTSAQLLWLSFSDPEVGFEISIVREGQGPDTSNSELLDPSQRNYSAEGLLPNTAYRAFIRSLCTFDTTAWVNHSFLTDIRNGYDCLTSRPIPDDGCNSSPLDASVHVDWPGSDLMGVDISLSKVHLIIAHPYPADLKIELISPSGQSAILTEHHGTLSDDFGLVGDSSCTSRTTFSDNACNSIYEGTPPFIGEFQADEPLAVFSDGESASGEWILRICDRASDDVGELQHVFLDFSTQTCPTPSVPQLVRLPDDEAVLHQEVLDVDSLILLSHNGQGPPDSRLDSNYTRSILDVSDSLHLLTDLDFSEDYEYYSFIYCDGEWWGPSCPGIFTTYCGDISMYESWDESAICTSDCDTSCPLTSEYWYVPEESAAWSVRQGVSSSSYTGPQEILFTEENPYLYSWGLDWGCREEISRIRSVCLEGEADSCGWSFFYHMQGIHSGYILALLSQDEWASADTLFVVSGDQGPHWQRADMGIPSNLNGPFQLEIQAGGATGAFSDVAIGDIAFSGLTPIANSDQVSYLDRDRDGHGDPNTLIFYCGRPLPDSLSLIGNDCDDENSNIHPGAVDLLCSGIDENCDGVENIGGADPLNLSIVSMQSPTCPADGDGAIEIEVTGGFSPYDIQWNTGDSTHQIDSLFAGEYQVTVSDSNTCQMEILDITLSPTQELNFSFNVVQRPSCLNSTGGIVDVEVAGGTAPYEILWSNGDTGQRNESLTAGYFSVTVSDANGCVYTSEDYPLRTADEFQLDINVLRPISCYGGTDGELVASVSGARDPLQYSWNTGDSTRVLGGLAQGSYQVTVTDSTDCQVVSDTLYLSDPDSVGLSILRVRPQRCSGISDGSIEVRASGGQPPYTYSWINPEGEELEGRNLTGLSPGSYHLTITDQVGCTFNSSAIEIPPAAEINVVEVVQSSSSCPLSPDGGLSLALDGGVPPLAVSWSDGGSNQLFRDDLVPGFYTLTLTDGLGCKTNLGPYEVESGQDSLELSVEPVDTLACGTGDTVSIAVAVESESAPFDFHWSNGFQRFTAYQEDTLAATLPGTYSLTVTDAFGCVGEEDGIEVVGVSPIDVSEINTEEPWCPDYKNGQISVNAQSPNPPLRYLWSTGSKTATINDLVAGDYHLTIEDESGCLPRELSVDLAGPPPFSFTVDSLLSTGPHCFKLMEVSGGRPPYQYRWNGETSLDSTFCIDPMERFLELEVEDQNGCIVNRIIWDNTTSSDFSPSGELAEIRVFPNPVGNRLCVENPEQNKLSISLWSAQGQLLDQWSVEQYRNCYDHFHQYSPGSFILEISNDLGHSRRFKVIKQ